MKQLSEQLQEAKEALGKKKEQVKQLTAELNEAEDVRSKHQATLENNRDLIALLRQQLQKSVDKQKALDGQHSTQKDEIKQQKIELLQGENQKLKKESEKVQNQNQVLKEQVTSLKLQFQEKMQTLSNKIDQLQHECGQKEELVNEANTAIEELTDEKHDIKAKLKHLLQVYVHHISQSDKQSSYKGDDSSLSVGDCFEKLQEALEGADQDARKTMVEKDSDDKIQLSEIELDAEDLQDHKRKLEELRAKMATAGQLIGQQAEQASELANKLQTAGRKLSKYKSELAKKCR